MLPNETISSGAPQVCDECHTKAKLGVYSSTAGYYIGTYCECGPYSRESEYFKTHALAEEALESGGYWR